MRPVQTKRLLAFALAFFFVRPGLVRAQAPGASAPVAVKKESRFRALIGEVFTQDEVRDANAPGAKEGYWFQAFDEKKGYARVVGPFDGAADFFLFRGKGRDDLAVVEYACGAACTQRVTVHRFDAAAEPARIRFMDFLDLDLARFESTFKGLASLCLDAEGNFDTERVSRAVPRREMPPCPFVFSFTKLSGGERTGLLFQVLNENGSDLALSVGKTRVRPRIELRWNGSRLVGSESGGGPDVFLGGAKMRELF